MLSKRGEVNNSEGKDTLWVLLSNDFSWDGSKSNQSQKYEQLAKWIAKKRKQPRLGHFLKLSLCGRVIEEVGEVTNRWAAE